MTTFFAILLAVLVYPGLLVAGVAAWLFIWMRDSARGAVGGMPISAPGRVLGEVRGAFSRETITPHGVPSWVVSGLTSAMFIAPLLALILLPLPGNPLASALGWQGDLALESSLIVGVPAARMVLAWAIPASATRLAGDRAARQLVGVAAPMVFALASSAQLNQNLFANHTPATAAPSAVIVLALIFAAAAFAGVAPALSRSTAVERDAEFPDLGAGALSETSGRDYALARLGEYLQLAAVAAVFVTVFLQPFFRIAPVGVGRGILWVVALILTVVGLGVWEGLRSRFDTAREHAVLAWWSGWPLMFSLAALVATAWALRG